MPTKFEFVETDPTSNPKPGKSLQIRRHCMQGKNKRENSRRSLLERKRNASQASQSCKEAREHVPNKPITMAFSVSPQAPLAKDLAFIRYAIPDLDAPSVSLIFKAFTYSPTNQAMSTLSQCVDFAPDALSATSYKWLVTDKTFLHAMLCTGHAINDVMSPDSNGKPGLRTMYYWQKTLSVLRGKLDDANVYEDEAIIQVVLTLALLSAMFGDWPAAAVHYEGLRRIVNLKGGIKFLRKHPKLHFQLDRIDLAKSMTIDGKQPFISPVEPEPLVRTPRYPQLSKTLYAPSPCWDPRLISVFEDFQFLTHSINTSVKQRVRYNAASFQNTLTSIQSRLLHMNDLSDNVQEIVRLTMMCLIPTMYHVPGKQPPFIWVNNRLKELYETVSDGTFEENKSLYVWVLVCVAMSTPGRNKDWVWQAWEKTDFGVSWSDVKKLLVRMVWIEKLHDTLGQRVFEQLENSRMLREELSLDTESYLSYK